MNLKDRLTALTDEELCEILQDLKDLQEKRQKEKEEPEYYYEFTGTWSWGVWAKSEEEARKYLSYADITEFDILPDEHMEKHSG